MNTILQVPMSKELRDQAASQARNMGFSSLQETVRVFLGKLAQGQVNIKFEEAVQLSPKAIKRYNKIIDEIESGKEKVYSAKSVDDLMKQLSRP